MKLYMLEIKIFIMIFLSHNLVWAIAHPRILIINSWANNGPSGLITNYAQTKAFMKGGLVCVNLCWKNSHSEYLCQQAGMPYCVFKEHDQPYFSRFDEQSESNIYTSVLEACTINNINIVITNRWEDITILKKVAFKAPIKIIFHRFGDLKAGDFQQSILEINNIDAVVGNVEIIEFIEQSNAKFNLNIKHISPIIPFWDEDKCVQFSTHQTRQEYFKNRFNIVGRDRPILCTIANFFNPCKNHSLLLEALHILIFKKKKPLLMMLAGYGPLQASVEQLVKDLNLQNNVFFLGAIEDIPALLYHSDFHVLPSYYENFSLANLEASCMKKPVICAREVNSARLIKDQETGLLFKSNDKNDLVEKIEYLLDHPEIRISMGEKAYNHVRNMYSNDSIYDQWKNLFDFL